MKNCTICIVGLIITLLTFTNKLCAQKTESAEFDSLRHYNSLIKNYQDSASYKMPVEKIIALIEKSENENFLFYAYAALGNINRLTGRYELAMKNLFHALEYSDYVKNQLEVAEIYDDLVYIYRIKGDTERMFEAVNKAIAIKENLGNLGGIHESKGLLSHYYRHSGDYIKAFKIEYEALEFHEEQKDTVKIIFSLHNIAMAYKAIGNYQKALKTLDKTYKLINHPGYKREKSMIYNGRGTVLLNLGKYQDALDHFTKSLEIETERGSKFRILTRYNNIGLCYSFLGNFEPALNNFRICIDEYKKSGRLRNLANIYNSVGMCYEEMANPDSSVYYYLKSIELCEANNFIDLHMNSAHRISKIFKDLGKIDSAYIYLNKYHELFDSIDKSNLTWVLIAEEIEYMRKKDQRLKDAEKRVALFFYILIAGVLIFISLLSWIIIIKQKAKIQKALLNKQELEKQEIELKDQINNQNKELVSKILQLNDSNSGVKLTIQKLIKLKSEMGVNSKQKIQQVINDLEHSVNNNIWDEFEHRFMKVHPLLYKKLSISFPNLTISERRLCALIHLNFSSKEIAHITKQSYKSILVAKSRLRSKLNIDESIKITDFFHRLVQA